MDFSISISREYPLPQQTLLILIEEAGLNRRIVIPDHPKIRNLTAVSKQGLYQKP